MLAGQATLDIVIASVKEAQDERFTGRKKFAGFSEGSSQWFIDFFDGIIVWCNSSLHRNRRFKRILGQYIPTLIEGAKLNSILPPKERAGDYWEFRFLETCRRKGLLTINQFEDIVNNYCVEAFVALSNQLDVRQESLSNLEIPETLVRPSLDKVLTDIDQWEKQRKILSHKYSAELLSQFSFDSAPILKQEDGLKDAVNPVVFKTLKKVLTGQNTFWDIAFLLKQNWISVACVLLPLMQGNNIKLEVPRDIALVGSDSASGNGSKADTGKAASKGLVACIDDSPVIAKELESILKPQGYEVLAILDPVKELASLLKAQPNMIFLDLVMPNTNGYEMCSFLRKTPQFKDIPIVMLTGHDGIVDRLKAKMVGSNDFLGKPPDPVKVIQAVQKHIGQTATATH